MHTTAYRALSGRSPFSPPDTDTSTTLPPIINPDDEPCYEDNGTFCEWVYDISGENEDLANVTNWVIGKPLTVAATLAVAWLINRLVRRAIASGVPKIVNQRQARVSQLEGLGIEVPESISVNVEDPRTAARTAAITTVLLSAVSVTIWSIALLMVLATIGIQIGPLLAGAGIVGIALGFGAQELVKDCIAGFFMLVEDQFGIGDVVDTSLATGTVESISLRTTVLRSVDGTVWHVPNGQMQRVGNLSQRYSMAVVDVDVAYATDLAAARHLLERAAAEVCVHEEHRDKVMEPPQVLGVERLGSDGITLRLTCQVHAGEQWALQRAIREHVKLVFDREGVEIPFPQRTVWNRVEPEPTEPTHDPTADEVPPSPKFKNPKGSGAP